MGFLKTTTKAWGALLLVGLVVLFSSDVFAANGNATISLGDVSSEIVRVDVDLPALLRTDLEHELVDLDLRRAAPRKVLLSASLVTMKSESTATKASVTCVVSAMLIDATRGTVLAILQGRARAENATAAPSLERAAMTGAVHSVFARLPEAMR